MPTLGSVRLARSAVRLLAGPALVGLAGAIATAAGFMVGGPIGNALLLALLTSERPQ